MGKNTNLAALVPFLVSFNWFQQSNPNLTFFIFELNCAIFDTLCWIKTGSTKYKLCAHHLNHNNFIVVSWSKILSYLIVLVTFSQLILADIHGHQ
jgi:hypothetical protein